MGGTLAEGRSAGKALMLQTGEDGGDTHGYGRLVNELEHFLGLLPREPGDDDRTATLGLQTLNGLRGRALVVVDHLGMQCDFPVGRGLTDTAGNPQRIRIREGMQEYADVVDVLCYSIGICDKRT